MNKSVTVVIPTIGRPQYIKSTIESVLNQSYSAIEILISDNAPIVSTRSILGENIDSRIKIIEHNNRISFSEHMNICIKEAQGYYVIILSDDDLISKDYISDMVSLFENNDNVTVGLGHQKILNERDTSLVTTERRCQEVGIFNGEEYMMNHYKGNNIPLIYTFISLFSKKEYILSAGGFRDYLDGSNADNYLFFSLLTKGNLGVSNSVMGYRVYQGSYGLSTPFERLYHATSEYDKDISSLIWDLEKISLLEKIAMRFKSKLSSASMLKYRLLNIYIRRESKFYIFKNLIRVRIMFLLRNIF